MRLRPAGPEDLALLRQEGLVPELFGLGMGPLDGFL